MNTINPILNTDSYKASHFLQYPPGITNVSSYIEARTGGKYMSVCFFGLQPFLQDFLTTQITVEHIQEAKDIIVAHGEPFNEAGWMHIVNNHAGYLPLSVKALPEGTVVPTGIPLVQIEVTDPACFWLVSYLETALLRAVWYGTTVATYSREVKKVLLAALDKTSENPRATLPFMLHDFGARGVSSNESAIYAGLAHLLNFQGTDTLATIAAARRYYGEPMAGFSVPAAEHSTITSWGKDREADAYANMIQQFGDGIVSIVSDSYDLWNAIDNIYGVQLKQSILDMKGRLVVRPDSGDPAQIVLEVVQKLDAAFGSRLNSKDYLVLNDKVRVIQGDGVTIDTIGTVLDTLAAQGYAAENVVFGMGGALLQNHTRDDARFAMKCNAIQDANGVWQDVYKNPVTDPSKASKAGRQVVLFDERTGVWSSERMSAANASQDRLQLVYQDGIARTDSFDNVRARAALAY